MFTVEMTYEEMDRVIFEKEKIECLSIEEIADSLSEEDLELYLEAYCKKFNLTNIDLSDFRKVSGASFVFASKLQSIKSR